MECFDGERICCKCKRKEAWLSCRDCVPIRDFCEECFEEHHRGMKPHSVLDISRRPRPPPKVPKCKRHTDHPRTAVCNKCKASLCVVCILEKNAACPSTGGKHDIELASEAVKSRREEMTLALGKAFSQKVVCEGYLGDLDRMEKEVFKRDDQIERDLTTNHFCLQKKRGDHLQAVRELLLERREKVRDHLDAIQQRSAEAETLLSRSSDVEICEKSPSLVSQLTAPVDFTLPNVPLITLGCATVQEGVGELAKAVASMAVTSPFQTCGAGSTACTAISTATQTECVVPAPSTVRSSHAGQSTAISSDTGTTAATSTTASTSPTDTEPTIIHTKAQPLEVNDKLRDLYDRCTVDTSVGPVVVETFGTQGLYSTGPDGERVKVSKDGVYHLGVCTGMDERVVYSTTWKKNTITMYFTMNGKLVQISEVSVEGAKYLSRIRAGPTTGRLVMVDEHFPRLTIHSPDCTLLRCINSTLGGGIILRVPDCAAWSQCEKYLYVSDWRTDAGKDERVLKLSLTDPPQLMWTAPMEGEKPLHVQPIGQCVYITHSYTVQHKVTVLSEVDGSVLKVISCPGVVREVKSTANGELELVYYS